MDMITVTAKTVDEAVTKALIELQTTSDKLEYEVVDKGSTGFLGIGSKPAIIRAKKGLPPTKVGNVDEMLKKIEAREEKAEQAQMAKIAKTKSIVEESTKYYNDNAKPGSLAAKANMVSKYNEKHEKGKK